MARREEDYVGRSATEIEVQGIRNRGIPNISCLEKVKDDNEKGLSADVVYDRVRPCYMEAYVIVHRPHIKVGIR